MGFLLTDGSWIDYLFSPTDKLFINIRKESGVRRTRNVPSDQDLAMIFIMSLVFLAVSCATILRNHRVEQDKYTCGSASMLSALGNISCLGQKAPPLPPAV